MSLASWILSILVSTALASLALAACPSGTYKGVKDGDCYWFPPAKGTWEFAETICQGHKGHLASVPNSFVNGFLRAEAAQFVGEEYFWLGGLYVDNPFKNKHEWDWMDGTPFNYTNWARGKSVWNCKNLQDLREKFQRMGVLEEILLKK